MTERRTAPAEPPLDIADRTMLAEIKAKVLGTVPEVLFIGHFRVIRQLGAGAMGVVLEAFDDRLDRRVALKLLHPGVGSSAEERTARLLQEAKAAAQLTHPNVVQVYEVGEHEEQVFMAMELVEGHSLDEVQRREPPLSWKELLALYLAAGEGLAAAHSKGVVHRDFKPHNVLVGSDGRVRVVDFGLARGGMGVEIQHTAEIRLEDEGAIERARLERLTATGANPGTPAYMAPELFEGEPATKASDQFSFCVALYEALYGRRPFDGQQLHELVAAAKEGRVVPPSFDRAVPRWLFQVIVRGLAPAPSERYPSMGALLEVLGRDRGRRRRLVLTSIAVVAVTSAAWWAGLGVDSSSTVEPTRAAAIEGGVEALRVESCTAETARMRSRWQDAYQRMRSDVVDGELDGLGASLAVGAEQFFERWEGSCREDVDGTGASCRERARIELESMLALLNERGTVREDAFHDHAYDLELCLEAGGSACGSAGAGEPATMALDAATAAERAGDFDAALEHAERAIRLAADPSHELTRLRASLRKASIHEARGEIDVARQILDRSMVSALVCGADVLAIDVALEQIESEALHSGDVPRATFAEGTATALLDRHPSGLSLRRARLLEKGAGTKVYLEHRCAEGLALLEDALRIREDAIGELRSRGRATELFERLAADAQLNIANARFFALAGYWGTCVVDGVDEAEVLESYRRARSRYSRAVGGNQRHLGLLEFDYSHGAALLTFGKPRDAVGPLESALAISEAHHGLVSPPVGDAHLALAEAHRQAGNFEEARGHAAANLEIRLQRQGEEGQLLTLAEAYAGLGAIVHEAGDLDAARDALLRSIEVLSSAEPEVLPLKEHEQLWLSNANLALLEWDRGDRGAARRALEISLELHRSLEARDEVEHPALPQERLVEARLLLSEGRTRRALEVLDGSEQLPGANPSITAAIVAEREKIESMNGLD